MATEADNKKVITPVARLSFPNLFHARSYNNQDPKFSCTLVFDEEAQKDPKFKAIKAAAAAAVRDKWGDNPPKNMKSPFRKGEEKEGMDGFPDGSIFIGCSSKQKPGVVNRKKDPIDEDEIKAGDYVIASIRAFAYDNSGNRGVSFGLDNVLKYKEGDPLGGGRQRAEKDFEDLSFEDDDSDSGDDSDIFGN